MKRIKINDIFPEHGFVDQNVSSPCSIQNINNLIGDQETPGECRNSWMFTDHKANQHED